MNTVQTRTIPLLDLQSQYREIREEVAAAVRRVMESQKFILGEDVKELEKEIASYCNARFAVGCASGSDALFLALLATGIQPGDEVLTAPYTFFATVGAIVRAGAIPVFVDIEAESFNIDAAQVEDALDRHPKVRAMIPIHLFGACADMDPLTRMAERRGIVVIEDAAQAIGAEYRGRRAGALAAVACLSFFPSKNLGACGDGGMLTTDDAALAERLASLRVHGSRKKYYHQYVGINSRLDALQAAILRVKLRHLDSWTAGRQRNADYYRRRLAELGVPVAAPRPHPYVTRHIYNQFVIAGSRRDELQAFLKRQGIGTEVYYPVPMHMQECFAGLGHREGEFPVSERMARESLALPVYPELSAQELDYICQALAAFYAP